MILLNTLKGNYVMGITTKELAKLCGVSRGTVDRALNNKTRISKETKEKILKAADEYGYRPVLLARSLVKGRTFCIGVVVFDVKNHYFSQMLSAIESSCKAQQYVVYFAMHEKDKNLEFELIQNLIDRRVDGLIICPVNKGQKFNDFLKTLEVPVVIIGNKVSRDVPYIGINEEKASFEATSLIISKGYENICFVCPPLIDEKNENIHTHKQRLLGFKKAVKQNGKVDSIVIGDWRYLDESINIANRATKKTAFFCSGDIYALTLLKEFRKKGYLIPQQFGLMGFDNIDMLEYITPSITTVANSIEDVAKKSVECLLKLISHNEVNSINYVSHTIIQGETIIEQN